MTALWSDEGFEDSTAEIARSAKIVCPCERRIISVADVVIFAISVVNQDSRDDLRHDVHVHIRQPERPAVVVVGEVFVVEVFVVEEVENGTHRIQSFDTDDLLHGVGVEAAAGEGQ